VGRRKYNGRPIEISIIGTDPPGRPSRNGKAQGRRCEQPGSLISACYQRRDAACGPTTGVWAGVSDEKRGPTLGYAELCRMSSKYSRSPLRVAGNPPPNK